MKKCFNCGETTEENQLFCQKCGSQLLANQISETNNQIFDDNSLVDAYIGKNADKFRQGGFSVPTFFLGITYFLYRKMWLLSFLMIIFNLLISLIFNSLGALINIVISILLAVNFKKIYLNHAQKKVERIKLKYSATGQEELIQLCRKKGGTTIIPLIIEIALFLLLMTISIVTAYKNINKYINDSRKEIEEQEKTKKDAEELTETLISGSIIGNLYLDISEIFVEQEHSSSIYKAYKTPSDHPDSCSLFLIKAKASYYNNDAKQYLEKNLHYSSNDQFSGIMQKEIGNDIWEYASITSSYKTSYYYAIVKDNSVYEIHINIRNDENKTCESAHNEIIKSVKFN